MDHVSAMCQNLSTVYPRGSTGTLGISTNYGALYTAALYTYLYHFRLA